MKTPQQRTARAGVAPVPGTRIAGPGLDGHDRGTDVIARGLRDTGYEVLGTGPHQTPAQIVATVFAEAAALPGLSVLSGGHLTLETIGQLDAAPNQTLEPTC